MSIPSPNALACLAGSACFTPVGSAARQCAEGSETTLGVLGWRTVAIIANVTEVALALLAGCFEQTANLDEFALTVDHPVGVASVGLCTHGALEFAENIFSMCRVMYPQQNQGQTRDGYIPLTGENSVVLEMDDNF